MPRSPSHSRPARRPRPHHPGPDLGDLVDQALRAADPLRPAPALTVAGARHGRLTAVGAPGPTADAVRGLVGFDAPDAWEALVVLVDGRAEAITGAPATDARISLAVDRHGRMAWRTELDRDGRVTVGRSEHDPPPEGRLVDICLRSLGLPTDPPPTTTTELWAQLWLDEVFEQAVVGRAPAGWAATAERHLALQMLAEDPTFTAGPDVELGPAGAALGRVITWERLRSECANGRWPVPDLTPPEAGWLDEGAFARWLLGTFLPVATVRREIEPLLSEPVLRNLDRVLERWGLAGRAGTGEPDGSGLTGQG